MENLDHLRQQINEIDDALVSLFKKRMEIVYRVAEYKIEHSAKVLDKAREEQIKSKHLSNIEDKDLRDELNEFLEDLMCISRKAQQKIIYKYSGTEKRKKIITSKIGFQGVPASFSHQALNEYFGENVETECFPNFKDVFDALQNGSIKYGVLPIENSSTGGIAEVYDLLEEYNCYIVGEKCIKVDHNLLAIEGTEISDIEEVYSHTQGFLQCSKFFDTHPGWTLIPYFNTAKSAEYVSMENKKNMACVASKKAAEIYGLKVLKENINFNRNNYTRFIIVGKEMKASEGCDKVSVVMALPHKPGSLYNILKHFSENNFNMLKIESRPIVNKSWEYYFYVDFQGNILNDIAKKFLMDVEKESLYFKLLGNYVGDARVG
jgi:chorismate mutase / prephenate dehydratase